MKKFVIAATAALTLLGAVASSTTEAHAKKWGWGKGAGIALGIGMLGAPAAASSYAYADDCRIVRVYNSYGEYIGRREICR